MSARSAPWLLILLAAFAAAIWLVDPSGDFPLNDDWSYAAAAQHLARTGEWRPGGWVSMPLLTHALWGAAACQVAALSVGAGQVAACGFETLRLSTLLAALVLLLAAFRLAREAGAGRPVATLGAAATSFNPITFPLAFTFMTDVPFGASLALAALAALRALHPGHAGALASLCLLGIAATLSRQLGLSVGIGFAAAYWVASDEGLVRRVVKAAAPLLTSAAALALHENWLARAGRMPALYAKKSQDLAETLSLPAPSILAIGTDNIVTVALYLGLLLLPLGLALAPGRRAVGRRTVLLASFVTAACALSLLGRGIIMPTSGNILVPSGTGPLTLRDADILHAGVVPALPVPFWALVTAASLLGLWVVVALLAAPPPFGEDARRRRAIIVFGTVGTAAYVLPLLIAGVLDRYVAAALPLLLPALIASGGRPRPQSGRRILVGGVWAGAVLAFGIAGTHDYLNWNRARWRAISALERSGTDPGAIDGGFEYGGLRLYDPAYAERKDRSWWWVADDRFTVTFGPLPGTNVVVREPYRTWLPPGQREILVLRRDR